MKIEIFKQIDYKPQSITSLSSTDSYIYLFRSNKSCNILNSMTLRPVFSFYTGLIIKKSITYKNFIICISAMDELIWINLQDFTVTKKNIGYKITDFIIHNEKFLVSTYNGFILEIEEENITIKYKTSVLLSCIYHFGDYFLIGGKDKIFIFDENFILKNEFEFDEGLINKIEHFSDNKFGFVTNTGYFILLDIGLLHVIQKTKVRNSSLNTLLIISDVFYTSGSDSRLISYKFTKNLFVKAYQVDLHDGISNCSIYDNNRILVGNTDGTLSVLIPQKDKFKYLKIYDTNVQVVSSKEKLLINNRTNLEIFSLSKVKMYELEKFTTNKISESCTFKLPKAIINDLSVRNIPYKNLLRIYSKFITSAYLENNLIIYSDEKDTKILEMNKSNVSKIEVEILKNFKSKKIFSTKKNFHFIDYFDNMKSIDKKTYELKQECSKKDNEEENEVFINQIGEYKLVEIKSYDTLKKYKIYFGDKEKKSVEIFDIIQNIFLFEEEVWYFTQSYIYNIERDFKYELGYIIYDIKIINEKIVVVMNDWKYLKKYVEQGSYKKKYSTK
ncbi:WD40 repeat domain-containing protein [Vairimorpha necatrix]|uniref:WD40 repeat domain-containing protein n=1 Tax=Vairimorpha necatrix TaxID=6039 RepID=A0AAX4JFI3_9MICR